ncbi:MAG TPA: hypothetical protein VL284_04060 [Thermoanaerobaculia bacterium]|nr:hypothetical protein [Thermoanaerobaculia bacterium]
MHRISIVAFLILAAACKIEKTGRDTYKVIAPTPQAKAAAARARAKTATAIQKLGSEVRQAGAKLKAKTETGTKTEPRR